MNQRVSSSRWIIAIAVRQSWRDKQPLCVRPRPSDLTLGRPDQVCMLNARMYIGMCIYTYVRTYVRTYSRASMMLLAKKTTTVFRSQLCAAAPLLVFTSYE